MTHQRLILASASAVWIGVLVACSGEVKKGQPSKQPETASPKERQEATKKIAAADVLWDSGDQARAVAEYKTLYDIRGTLATDKEKMLPRIVDFEVNANHMGEARTWMRRGLDDNIKAEYTSYAANVHFAAVQKEYDEARALAAAEQSRKKADAAAEAARKAEEEYEVDGLVLLRKTLHGTTDQVGGDITGIVVNRRAKTLSYVQITFNLYDRSGARVGTALANINNLEPGGRWNFKASTFDNFATFKCVGLSGY